MPTITIKYLETVYSAATNQNVSVVVGTESCDDIEESLLPKQPLAGKPVFITKKFVGHPEYRWQIKDVVVAQQGPAIFEVTLARLQQLSKSDYLPEILKGKTIMSILQKYAIVEVEFGHAPAVGKSDGSISSNKRYVDSIQDGNMPKRRLAIVLRAASKQPSGAIVQVVPISSVPPHSRDRTAIEVTSTLSAMSNYNKQSWAICGMVESVAAGRIIAPMRDWGKKKSRDTGFSTKLEVALRPAFETALLHGLDRAQLSQAIAAQPQLEAENLQLKADYAATVAQLTALQQAHLHAPAHERMARDLAVANGIPFSELREIY